MITRKLFALIAVLTLLLIAPACSAESELAVDDSPTASAAPTTEPTLLPEATTEPTAVIEPTTEAEPTEMALAADDVASFTASLQMALAQRDFDAVLAQLSDPFGFGPYRSEWSLLTPAEMVAQLENILPPGASLQFHPDADLSAMLDGQDPQMMLGPDVKVAAVLHSSGWGAEGRDEAILFVEELADGRFTWKAMIIAPDGFLPESAELPILDEQPAPVGLLYQKPDGSLWQVAADGQPVQLWYQEGTPATPAPDGQHAFYQIQGDLFLLDVTTGESVQLTSDHDADGTHLSGFHRWVDNDTILTGIWLDLETESGPNLGHPALINIATAELTMLDDQHLMSSYPAISGDGAIAYSSVQRSADDMETAWIFDPVNGLSPLFPTDYVGALDGAYSSPAWSEDGRSLAWLVSDGVNFQLAILDLENQTAVGMYAYQGIPFGGPFPNPIFSPSGNWIALRQFSNDPATTGLWLYALDGQEPLFIAQNGGESLWVNDQLLLFLDYDENFNAQLQQYNVQTGVRSVVTLPEVFQIYGIVVP